MSTCRSLTWSALPPPAPAVPAAKIGELEESFCRFAGASAVDEELLRADGGDSRAHAIASGSLQFFRTAFSAVMHPVLAQPLTSCGANVPSNNSCAGPGLGPPTLTAANRASFSATANKLEVKADESGVADDDDDGGSRVAVLA